MISDAQVRRVAAELHDGRWAFSLRQLYYAACADAEAPAPVSTAKGYFALGLLLVVGGLALIAVRPVCVALCTGGLLSIAFGALQRTRERPLTGRVLAMSYTEFEERFAALDVPGLLPQTARSDEAPLGCADLLLVCDTAETAAVIAANAGPGHLERITAFAGTVPNVDTHQRVAVLHDASPGGCSLPLELHDTGIDVVDCGLRPRDVMDAGAQVLEGAPARLPRELSGALTAAEIDWLRSGRRVELATLPPVRLVSLLRQQLPEQPAQHLAGLEV